MHAQNPVADFFSPIHQEILLGGHMAVPDSTLKSTVKEKYAQAALRVSEGSTAATCCGSGACCGATTETWDPITSELYDDQQKAGIPAEALLASLGCGNPTALAELKEREFLDLLREAGFKKASIEPTRVYEMDDSAGFLSGTGLDATVFASQIDGKFMSAFVRATKPLGDCCGPDSCGPDCTDSDSC